MVAEMMENVRKEGLGRYSIYPPFPCLVFLKGEKYSECFCNYWLLKENRAVLDERPENMRPCSFCKPQLETE